MIVFLDFQKKLNNDSKLSEQYDISKKSGLWLGNTLSAVNLFSKSFVIIVQGSKHSIYS